MAGWLEGAEGGKMSSSPLSNAQLPALVTPSTGKKGTLEYRMRFEHPDKGSVSPWCAPAALTRRSPCRFARGAALVGPSSARLNRSSPFLPPRARRHDIPLSTTDPTDFSVCNFLCEIPKWTRAKFEVCAYRGTPTSHQPTHRGSDRTYWLRCFLLSR